MSGTSARAASASDLLLDSDVCIDHFRGARHLPPLIDGAFYSLITRCELFSGRKVDEQRIRVFLDRLNEIGIDRSLAERAGRLRREFSLRTPDAIIAASALEHGLVLVSRNQRDFAKVDGLRLGTIEDIA
jgi:predicted nucleic acid-binding protein